jgi:hypothetical protein
MRPLDDAEQPQGERHNGEFQYEQISPRPDMVTAK